MKSDRQLQQDVLDELRWEPSIREKEIGVTVHDGVVTLQGVVESYAQKISAERAAARVSGVKAVAEELKVRIPSKFERTDSEIARMALDMLTFDVEVPDERIQVKVENGYVTLTGQVDWYYEKRAAERDVRRLLGVKGVNNLINIRAAVSPAEVKAKIEAALARSAEVDSHRISVQSEGSRVILKGTVRSWAERMDAERAAWSAPGVTAVEDDLLVGA